jgi:hypothetical protein
MASKHFDTHHSAAKAAHDSGDHAKAMHHIGHLMRAVMSARKSAGAPAMAMAMPDEDASPNDADDLTARPPTAKPTFNRGVFGRMNGNTK